jgi:hypothetical protein
MVRWIKRIFGWILLTFVGHYVWPVSEKLGEAAITEWVNHQIADRYSVVSPTQKQVIDFFVSWTIPALVVLVGYLLFRLGMWWQKRGVQGTADVALQEPMISKERALNQSQPQPEVQPDIDASEAYFQILSTSEWRVEQERTTADTSQLVYDWLEVRLSDEIHRALRNSRLQAWGEECLPGTATTPEKPIPPDTWDRTVIVFDNRNLRTSAHFRGRTSREVGRMAWVAVKFSKQQIFGIFPPMPAPSLDRISMAQLLKMAADMGWNFSSESLHLIDMQDAIRQGGLDGTLAVWGRRTRWTDERIMRDEVLEKIPPEHWKEFRVSLFRAAEDNFYTKSWCYKASETLQGYLDLHVERGQTSAWLKKDAAVFRGRARLR